MSQALADRVLNVLAEPVELRVVRALADAERTQASLVDALQIAQSIVSRAVKNLRSAGIVESDTPRGALRLRAEGELKGILLAADRFAEALLAADVERQEALSSRTRRTVIRAEPHTSEAGADRDA